MKKLITMMAILLTAVSGSVADQRVELGTDTDDLSVTVLEAGDFRTVVRFDVGAFTKEAVEIGGETFYKIDCSKESVLLNKDEPELPHICRSIIIPDNALMKINVLSTEYVDLPSTPVIPSKGNLYRNVNPDDISYSFGEVYNNDEWYPSELTSIREPYILRDFRGTVIELNAFRYNPVSKVLRVYTSVTVEVVQDGPGETNVLSRTEPFSKVTPDFELIYRERFINYNTGTLLYTPIIEEGSMLIITDDSFHDEMLPFVEWKMQKGIFTTIIDISEIENNSYAITSFIQDFYDTTDLAWVLLVGDAAQIATPYASGGSSDPSYAKVAGSDNYPDIFVGRFSAENVSHVQTQVERTINYEKYPQTADWYHQGTGIASDQGPGHHGEYDNEHMDLIRNDLLHYNYTLVDQIYDPNANSSMVANALNDGRSIVNYCGHGSNTSWGSSGFSNTNVNALVNDSMLPFIISVACVNGQFDGYTCFAEAWLRATNGGVPTGAIAVYMSSINQSWNPPMYGQDEAVDLLVADSMSTFGGICFNGSCYMIDVEGNAGVEMYDTWHIFGDPSVQLFTDTPVEMTVNHDDALIFTLTEVNVEVEGIEGALCALYHDGILYGSACSGSDGIAVITVTEQLPVGETITLTVTSQNKIPYMSDIQIIAPEGPYVVYDEYTINDIDGNDNGQVDFGESILLGIQLINVGPDQAVDVSATLSSTDSLVTITDDFETFGDIDGDNGIIFIADAYAFDVAVDIPDGHNLSFELEITGTALETWISHFTIPVHAPNLSFTGVSIDDEAGNGNGIMEAGETVNVIVTLANNGSLEAFSVAGTISEDDDFVSIIDADGTFGDIAPSGGTGDNSLDVFIVEADSSFPQGHSVTFDLAITSDGGYSTETQFLIRTAESFEYNDGGYSGLGNWQWGEPTSGPNEAYFGVNVWATNLGGDYGPSRDDPLIAPQLLVSSPGAQLEFYHWYSIENNYDGGNVSISTNGGASWTLITPETGYPGSNIYALGEAGYTGSNNAWEQAVFSLSAFAGENIIIRWRFASDYMINDAGWYIDDVAITGNIPQEPPELSIEPDSYSVSLEAGSIETYDLTLTNSGNGPLYFNLSAQTDDGIYLSNSNKMTALPTEQMNKPIGHHPASGKPDSKPEPFFPPVITDQGGPDEFGYSWIDSNEPGGPTYNWVDITSIGNQIGGLGDDSNVGPFSIGFNFDFYDNTFTTFRFCTNGFMSFTSTVTSYSNDPIPTGGDEPLNLVAPFWDDLNFNSGGNAYYYSNGTDSLVVSWINVPHYGSGGPYTFQVILLDDGTITFQYQNINSPDNSSTVGIQNSDGFIGLQVTYNASYIENNLAVEISTETSWLSVEPSSGVVDPDDSFTASVTFDATELEDGIYTGSIFVDSNDPENPEVIIAAALEVVSEFPCEYLPGDINGNGEVSIGDIVYGVQYFRNSIAPPPDSCYHDSIGYWLYVAGDVNGNCRFLGSDISYLVSFFGGVNPQLLWCPLMPPPEAVQTGIGKDNSPAVLPEK